jgi:predicted dehydrogenase
MSRSGSNRREFLKSSALAGVGLLGAGYFVNSAPAAESTSPNSKLRFACVGVGGKGKEEARDAAKFGDVVAICDIDDEVLTKIGAAHPDARHYQDFRDMLDEMRDSIDAVTVSTPDHSHAVIAAAAMKAGKHAFVQKPLTHDLWEARQLGKIAVENKVSTQMGNQHTADNNLRKAAAIVKSGQLGTVKEIHVWTNRPIWPQGNPRAEAKPMPKHLHWNLFCGTAPYRPFAENYHPFNWRGWWDFGTGSLGDMACHTMNMPFMALGLRDPISVQAETSGHNRDSYPAKSKITYEFASSDTHPALKLYWYDSSNKPSRDLLAEFDVPGDKGDDKKSDDDGGDKKGKKGRVTFANSGCIVVGDKAMLHAPGDYAEQKLSLSHGKEIEDVKFVESPGHWEEWVRAIKGGEPATSNFPGYAVPLTEIVLLGNLAIYAANEPDVPGKKIEWDAKNQKATNAPEVQHIVKREYRAPWSL